MHQIVEDEGQQYSVYGQLPKVQEQAPELQLVAGDLSNKTLKDFAGKRKVLNIFPSVDTPTCAASVRHFNADASRLENTVVLCISADLPFAQARFCGAEGLDNVIMLSTFRNPEFLKNYGVLIEEGPLKGLCARAVVIIDSQDKVQYTEMVKDLSLEPNYEKALSVISNLK